MYIHNPEISDILARISAADELMLNDILLAVFQRHSEIYAEWEAIYLTVSRTDPIQRRKQLEDAFSFLLRHSP